MTTDERLDEINRKLDLLLKGSTSAPRAPAAAPGGGMVFPPYGRSKGAPISGASERDLTYYRNGSIRTLTDPSKSRWHDKERVMLAAIEAEMKKQGIPLPESEGEPAVDPPPPDFGDGPGAGDDDIPF